MSTTRRLLLTALPKVPLSKLTGILASTPLPPAARAGLYRWFARRYGAELEDLADDLRSFRSLQAFFRRGLREGARPIADSQLVWPCDGRIVTAGPIKAGRIPQVKGNDYALADLLGNDALAAKLAGGQQATIYLAPGDYHRVHSPFQGEVLSVREGKVRVGACSRVRGDTSWTRRGCRLAPRRKKCVLSCAPV